MIDEKNLSKIVSAVRTLIFCYLPAILGGGALVWIFVVFGYLDLSKELRQERRAAESVGVHVYSKEPIKLLMHDDTCIKAGDAFIDGNHITFYVTNKCRIPFQYSGYVYRVQAPDGTVIESHGWRFEGENYLGPNEKKEVTQDIKKDDRIESVTIILNNGEIIRP